MQFLLLDVQVRHYAKCRGDMRPQEYLHLVEPNASVNVAHVPDETSTGSIKQTCIILLFGRCGNGDSICVRVSFRPRLFVQYPDGWSKETMNAFLRQKGVFNKDFFDGHVKHVSRKLFAGWESSPNNVLERRQRDFAEISFQSTKMVRIFASQVKKHVVRGSPVPGLCVLEAEVDVVQQFLDSSGLQPGGWVRLDEQALPVHMRCAWTNLEMSCTADQVTVLDIEDAAPLKVASIDGEMFSASGCFPNPTVAGDVIIGIGVTVHTINSTSADEKVYFALGQTSSVEGIDIRSFTNEKELLLAYRAFLITSDPDVIIGYNIFKFDMHYLGTRAQSLGVGLFFYQGRLIGESCSLISRESSSRAHGDNCEHHIYTPGRIQMDLLSLIKVHYKFRSYSLNSVSKIMLHDTKVDLSPNEMMTAYAHGGPSGRAKIGVYCIKDTELPLRLLSHIEGLQNLLQLARVTLTPCPKLAMCGQQLKVMNALRIFAHVKGFVVNAFDSLVESYQGATVIEPQVGFYDEPVVVMDFQSLYPSIIISNNLSHDTVVLGDGALPPHGTFTTDGLTDRFVNHEVGVLPQLLEQFLSARRAVKTQMKSTTDTEHYKVLNAKQAALKVLCNSVYGFCGVVKGLLPCLPVARTTTSIGRQMIEETRNLVHASHPGARTIYGDTDSVMVLLKGETVQSAFAIGERLSDIVTSHFGKAIKLEMEKVFLPYLLFKKKRYAALKFVSAHAEAKMEASGVEMVRRDTVPFAGQTYEAVLRVLLYDKDPLRAATVLFEALCRLEDSLVPIRDLSISCQLQGSYVTKHLAQVTVSENMKQRAPGTEPKPGDRMTYVVLQGSGPIYGRVEDPVYAEAKKLKLDLLYIMENQMLNPMKTLLGFFPVDVDGIFDQFKRRMKVQDVRLLPGLSSASRSPPVLLSATAILAADSVKKANSSKATVLQGADKPKITRVTKTPTSVKVQNVGLPMGSVGFQLPKHIGTSKPVVPKSTKKVIKGPRVAGRKRKALGGGSSQPCKQLTLPFKN